MNFSQLNSVQSSSVFIWLGGIRPCSSDGTSKSSFVWLDNTSLQDDKWGYLEPNNKPVGTFQETCMLMDKQNNYNFSDYSCFDNRNFVCQCRIDERKVIFELFKQTLNFMF